jgi:hypothetical protein
MIAPHFGHHPVGRSAPTQKYGEITTQKIAFDDVLE